MANLLPSLGWHVIVLSLLSSDGRFPDLAPSTVACACVTIAMQRLNLLSTAVTVDSVLQFLANLLNTDLVRVMFNWCFKIPTVGLCHPSLREQPRRMQCWWRATEQVHVWATCQPNSCVPFALTLTRTPSASAPTSSRACRRSCCPSTSSRVCADQPHAACWHSGCHSDITWGNEREAQPPSATRQINGNVKTQ